MSKLRVRTETTFQALGRWGSLGVLCGAAACTSGNGTDAGMDVVVHDVSASPDQGGGDTVLMDVSGDINNVDGHVDAGQELALPDVQRCSAMPQVGPRTLTTPSLAMDNTLRLNHLQARGTHNSYHIKPAIDIPEWNYTHAPLDVQLDTQGVRQFELDLHWNPDCGYFEIYHVDMLDERTTCKVFRECLATLRRWSDEHPGHHPLFVMLEPKELWPAAVVAERITALETEIASIFPAPLVITPDEVKGTAVNLRTAVTTVGWPTLGATRGRILFFMNEEGPIREHYTSGQTTLDGRLIFAQADEDDPYAAVVIHNNPVGEQAAIQSAVRAGFLVRTFSEQSIEDGFNNVHTGQDAALASGAHLLSTDFPVPQAGGVYFLDLPGGTPSRCNPLLAVSGCSANLVEDPARLVR